MVVEALDHRHRPGIQADGVEKSCIDRRRVFGRSHVAEVINVAHPQFAELAVRPAQLLLELREVEAVGVHMAPRRYGWQSELRRWRDVWAGQFIGAVRIIPDRISSKMTLSLTITNSKSLTALTLQTV